MQGPDSLSGTLLGSGRTGVGETQAVPATSLEEAQCREGRSCKVLVAGDGGGGSGPGMQARSTYLGEIRKGFEEKI